MFSWSLTRRAAVFISGCVTDTHEDKWKPGAPLKQPAGSKRRDFSVADGVVLLGFDGLGKSVLKNKIN